MKIKTHGDSVKQVKNLFSTLGIDYWYVYATEYRCFDYSITYTEDSKIVPVCGDHYTIETCLTVSDPIELFILKEQFLFVMK